VLPVFSQAPLRAPEIGTFTGGRFHHTLTGTEFSFPPNWTLAHQGPSGGGGQLIRFILDSTPHVEAFVWMKPHTMAPADIPDKLRSLVDFKAGQRERVPGYHMLRNTIEKKTVGGQAAVSIEAGYITGDGSLKMIEYNTWVISEKTHANLCARVRAEDFPSLKGQIDQILASFMVP
jgi:hypothetical protein